MQTSIHIQCDELPWSAGNTPGVEYKTLSPAAELGGFEVSLVRLAAGASFVPPASARTVEVFVLTGSWDSADGTLQPNSYLRSSPAQIESNSTEAGCTLFVRAIDAADPSDVSVTAQTDELPWHPGHGNLRVKPLHSHGTEGTALVHWPQNERFIPHRHFGGEEIFVLSGTFLDEHGRYPKHSWILNPHLSAHHPFVEEETVILVKTGHLAARA